MNERHTCMVVGATGTIGAEIARELARQGNDLVLVYRSAAKKAEQLDHELQRFGGKILTQEADVTDRDAVARVTEKTIGTFGRIDALINTQGWLHELLLLQDETPDNIQKTINIELCSVIHTCQAVIPTMMRQKQGRIVTVGSDSGKAGFSGGAISSACRAGVIGLSKSMARELASYNITANVVCPGPTESPLLEKMLKGPGLTSKLIEKMIRAIPMQRVGTPNEVAALAVFLASSQASFITGQAISVNGGLTMS